MWTAVIFLAPVGQARDLLGKIGDQEIRLKTELITGTEYVRAADLVSLFPDRYQYDALSGTLIFTRSDGFQVGLKVDDERVVVGNRIYHTGILVIRRQTIIYIPFYYVNKFLLPQTHFIETTTTDVRPTGTIRLTVNESINPVPTPAPYRFALSTPTPSMLDMASTPTVLPLLPTSTPVPYFFPTPTIPAIPFTKMVILLDPAHDPAQPGAATTNGIPEWELTLAICEQMEAFIKQTKNYEVYLTHRRGENQALSNEQRTLFANEHKGNLFVSIHCGALFTNKISKAGVFFMNPELDRSLPTESGGEVSAAGDVISWQNAYRNYVTDSLKLAQKIHSQLQTLNNLIGIFKLDSNPRPGRFAVLRGLVMPGVIVELGNPLEPNTAQYLGTPRTQHDLAYALSTGIMDFLYEQYQFLNSNRMQ